MFNFSLCICCNISKLFLFVEKCLWWIYHHEKNQNMQTLILSFCLHQSTKHHHGVFSFIPGVLFVVTAAGAHLTSCNGTRSLQRCWDKQSDIQLMHTLSQHIHFLHVFTYHKDFKDWFNKPVHKYVQMHRDHSCYPYNVLYYYGSYLLAHLSNHQCFGRVEHLKD